MNFQMTAEQQMLIHSLGAFLEQEVYPHEAEVDRAGLVPPELCEQIKKRAIEMGFFVVVDLIIRL
jgi:acyl-CoA dehydrogenase